MSDDDSSKKIASSKDFETTTNTEDVTECRSFIAVQNIYE